MTPPCVIHREHETLDLGARTGARVREIGRERRDAALAREMIPEHRDPVNRLRHALVAHPSLPSRSPTMSARDAGNNAKTRLFCKRDPSFTDLFHQSDAR